MAEFKKLSANDNSHSMKCCVLVSKPNKMQNCLKGIATSPLEAL